MAFSGGVFTLVAGNPVITGTTISSTTMNNTLSDIATGLSTCILKDGSQTITANIPMSSFKLTGLGAGSASGDSLRYEQVNGIVTTAGDILYATSAGTLARLAIGTANQTLKVNAGATAPTWVTNTAATTFLAADVNLNNTANFFSGPNTGSIGGAGQTWLIMAVACMNDTAGGAILEARIYDGSTVYADTSATTTALNNIVVIPVVAVVSLSGATTFTLSVRDQSSTSGILYTTGNGTTANKATSITAIRIT